MVGNPSGLSSPEPLLGGLYNHAGESAFIFPVSFLSSVCLGLSLLPLSKLVVLLIVSHRSVSLLLINCNAGNFWNPKTCTWGQAPAHPGFGGLCVKNACPGISHFPSKASLVSPVTGSHVYLGWALLQLGVGGGGDLDLGVIHRGDPVLWPSFLGEELMGAEPRMATSPSSGPIN